LDLTINWSQEILNFGTPLANNEASKTEFIDVFFGHVQFVDQLSSIWGESRLWLSWEVGRLQGTSAALVLNSGIRRESFEH